MAFEKKIFGFVDPSREVRRPPLVGMEFLHERAMRSSNVGGARSRLNAKDLISLLFRHFSAVDVSRPRCRTRIRVLTPGGFPAVKIRHQ